MPEAKIVAAATGGYTVTFSDLDGGRCAVPTAVAHVKPAAAPAPATPAVSVEIADLKCSDDSTSFSVQASDAMAGVLLSVTFTGELEGS